MTIYECEICVLVEAGSAQEAANEAQAMVDTNSGRWMFDVRNLDSGVIVEGIEAEQ